MRALPALRPAAAASPFSALLGGALAGLAALDDLRQVVARAGLTYDATAAVRLAGGYATALRWTHTISGTARGREHRAWQMVQLAHGAGPVRLTHRARLEQRHVGTAVPTADDTRPALRWGWSQRAR